MKRVKRSCMEMFILCSKLVIIRKFWKTQMMSRDNWNEGIENNMTFVVRRPLSPRTQLKVIQQNWESCKTQLVIQYVNNCCLRGRWIKAEWFQFIVGFIKVLFGAVISHSTVEMQSVSVSVVFNSTVL